MIDVLVNIDVGDLDAAIAFYTRAFDLRVARRLGDDAVELVGGSARIYLLRADEGSAPFDGAATGRAYRRHWTPVHVDLVVPDLEEAVARALGAGAAQEGAIRARAWGRIANLVDPFGHGLCLVAFSDEGYDELLPAAERAKKQLLVVAHAPSENTRRLLAALVRGAQHPDAEGVAVKVLSPFEARPADVLAAEAIVLLTPENLGAMSGALKDFFDRVYYPCLDRSEGLPYALVVRGRHDGTGTRRGVESIASGLRWKPVEAPLLCIGELDDAFVAACEELGAKMAIGLDAGIF